MRENRPADDRRTPKKRKKPLKQRIAIAIVRAVEGREQKKNAKAKPQTGTARRTPPAQGQPRSASAKRQAQIRRLRRRQRMVRVAIGVIAVCVLFLILARTVLFKIQNIEVTNPEAANYTTEQIVAQCGVTYGTQNLFSCDLGKVAKNIEQRLPYIGKATVERHFPSSLRVTVEPTKAAAAIAYGTGYLCIDADGKMLESVETAPETVPVLRCNTEFEMNLGQYIGVTATGKKADDKTKAAAATVQLFKRVNEGVAAAGIEDITLIDIRDTRAITLMYQNRLTLHLGTEDALETKLQTAAKTIAAENDGSKTRTGAIDLTTVPYAFARDTYEPASEVEATSEENTTGAATAA
ncbi:MAG: FtsQ-type POTRA domain-containing protein [Oscillospiraceae bacterium]|nr:FtsQ-type POTRA domain-containing protein [Oscillospiraceae bacterium]